MTMREFVVTNTEVQTNGTDVEPRDELSEALRNEEAARWLNEDPAVTYGLAVAPEERRAAWERFSMADRKRLTEAGYAPDAFEESTDEVEGSGEYELYDPIAERGSALP